jgi:hypothetical protein
MVIEANEVLGLALSGSYNVVFRLAVGLFFRR